GATPPTYPPSLPGALPTPAETWSPLVLQHLLLGMNAHINLDLGIAAAETAPGTALPALKRDFDEITTLLGEMLDDVQDRIGRIRSEEHTSELQSRENLVCR